MPKPSKCNQYGKPGSQKEHERLTRLVAALDQYKEWSCTRLIVPGAGLPKAELVTFKVVALTGADACWLADLRKYEMEEELGNHHHRDHGYTTPQGGHRAA